MTPVMDRFVKGQRRGRPQPIEVVALARWASQPGHHPRHELPPQLRSRQRNLLADHAKRRASFENLLPNSSAQLRAPLAFPPAIRQLSSTLFGDVGEEPGRVFAASSGVNLDTNILPQPDGLYVVFRPSGRCDPGTIRFTDRSGKLIEVGCLTGTEQYHVLSDDEKQLEQSMAPAPPGQSW